MKFQPGESGNPNGRPLGASNKRTELIKLLEPHAPALINKCVELALAGNEACIRLALDKLLPRAKDTHVNFNLPTEKLKPESLTEVAENILRQVETGELTPEQAKTIFDVIKSYRIVVPELNSKALSLMEMLIDKL